jgi:putative addiction module killer protein
MYKIKRTDEFSNWLDGLKDPITKQRLVGRLRKAMNGNLGGTKFVGEGVFEMREHFGCGWRMYYVQRGDKSTQANDIAKAQKLASTLE